MKITIICATLLLAACVSQAHVDAVRRAEIDKVTLSCSGPDDCGALWDAVTRWATDNRDMTVQEFTPRRLNSSMQRWGCWVDVLVLLQETGIDSEFKPSQRYSRPHATPRPGACANAPAQLELEFHRAIEQTRTATS